MRQKGSPPRPTLSWEPLFEEGHSPTSETPAHPGLCLSMLLVKLRYLLGQVDLFSSGTLCLLLGVVGAPRA